MLLSHFARTSGGALLGLAALTSIACAPTTGPSPKTVVDQATPADAAPATDATPVAPAKAEPAKAEATEIEPVGIPIEGSELVEGKATVTVNGPYDKVRATVLKWEDYPQYMPEYSGAKQLGKLPNGNEKVYMEITTLGGIAKMFANVEIVPSGKEGASETFAGKFIDGNVKQFKAVWSVSKLDAARTEISLQVFLLPSIPLPDFLVNKANLDGAKKGVLAMKKRVETAP